MYFRSYRLSETWLDHFLKSTVSELPLRVNMLKDPKQLLNLDESPFIIFFRHSEQKWLAKYLFYWNLTCYGCLLTHWVLLTSILFGNVRICFCLFKDNYLQKEKFILHILFNFWNLHQILKISKKKKIVIGYVFLKLQIVKDLLRAPTNKRCFRTCFESQHLKGSQTLKKQAREHF